MASNTHPPVDRYRLPREVRATMWSLSCVTAESGFPKKICQISLSAFIEQTRLAHELSELDWAFLSPSASPVPTAPTLRWKVPWATAQRFGYVSEGPEGRGKCML